MRLIPVVALALTVFASPVLAQDEEDVMSRIETLHGESEAFGEAFGALQDSFLFDDPSGFADLAFYPLEVAANGEVYDILEPQDLVDNFDTLLTAETIEGLIGQDFNDLIVTSEGVGFANGALWMALICFDDSCSETGWGITRINNQ